MPTKTVPMWKRWLSHVAPLTIEETGSEYNPELTVRLDKGRIQLLSGNAIYSWEDLYHNFARALETVDPVKRNPKKILLLGLGLGSVPYLLEKTYGLRCHYVSVDWDEAVAELAEKYTLSQLSSTTEVVIADATVFVAVCEETFDWIVVDIFEDNTTPESVEDEDFLSDCRALLRPGGLLLFNRLYHSDRDKILTERFYEEKFKKTFPEGWKIDTKGNWILCFEQPALSA